MIYFCSQQNRRALVLQHATLNGIDYLEVADSDCGCGRTLLLTLLRDAAGVSLTTSQIAISGGASDAQVSAKSVAAATSDAPRTLTIELDATGDLSTYTLSLIANPDTTDPPDGFDPQLSSVAFSFKAGCATVSDCAPTSCCTPPRAVTPDINYLAKDFTGFTQVMLDRLAVLVPGWNETHAPDLGIALVELLAYAADHLSYQQDAAGTEAYIGTARSRISLRRHARLVDYKPDEGANARTWIYAEATQDGAFIPAGTALYPTVPGYQVVITPGSRPALDLANGATQPFETMQDATLYTMHNELDFYTWSDANCCLAPGSTQATLKKHFPNLQAGQVLILAEKYGPNTGEQEDADVSKRWPVRLTRVQQTDYADRPLVDPLNGCPVTRIWWAAEDALPFPLCISSTTDSEHGSKAVSNVSIANGNIIPADHGAWQGWEDLGDVPSAPPAPVTSSSCSCGSQSPIDAPRPRYFPQLAKSPLTFAVPLDTTASAAEFLMPASSPVPQLQVRDDRQLAWTVLDDLLSSTLSDRAVIPEIERDNTTFLRFGDGQYGMSSDAAASFQAYYRVGNGSIGNIGHNTIGHIVTGVAGIRSVTNPLSAAGGRDPETMQHIRQTAPYAFRSQLRAVTEDDYGTMAQVNPAVREARGTLRWTGAWYTAFVSIDAASGDVPAASLVSTSLQNLNLLRMAGVDLAVEGAVIVGLRIEMDICVAQNHFQSDVRDALMSVFTSGDQCSGKAGILSPENFTFGQTIYASPLIGAAQAVEGVSSVTLTVFERMNDPSSDGTARGLLVMQRLEIARCDNDPTRLDHGLFVLHMDGGK